MNMMLIIVLYLLKQLKTKQNEKGKIKKGIREVCSLVFNQSNPCNKLKT